jgi:hypothetical protein
MVGIQGKHKISIALDVFAQSGKPVEIRLKRIERLPAPDPDDHL